MSFGDLHHRPGPRGGRRGDVESELQLGEALCQLTERTCYHVYVDHVGLID